MSDLRPVLERGTHSIHPAVAVLAVGALLIAIGLVDRLTGVFHLTILYIAPLVIAAYYFGFWGGLVTGLLGVAEVVTTHAGQHSAEFVQDVATDLVVFLVVAAVIDRMRSQLSTIRALEARRDVALRIAREVQESMLGDCPSDDRFEVACHVDFVREVGGDYYRFEQVGGGLLLFAADISGKGMSAALFAVLLDDAIRGSIGGYADLPSLVRRLNVRLYESMPSDMFVTLVVARIDETALSWVNCGHVPPLLLTAEGRVTELPGGSPPLGVGPMLSSHESTRPFLPGEMLLVCSDGVTESPALMASPGSLGETMLASSPGGVRAVVDAVARLAVSRGQTDDVTVLCVRRR